MGRETLISIAIQEAQMKLANQTFTCLEDKVKAAMRVTVHHWLVTDEAERFVAAVCAAIAVSEQEDRALLEKEFGMLRSLDLALCGVPIDFSKFHEIRTIGLMKLWDDVKKEEVG